jgi:hypothetical protein
VDIDSLAPPVRAAIRALLAQINGHDADVAYQFDLAMAAGHPAAIDAIMVVLGWGMDQLDWCRHHHVPAPEWIAAAGA